MKQFSQCLMCKYVFGRTCKLTNKIIDTDIFENKLECNSFISIIEEELDIDDSCCSEKTRYKSLLNK
ncbi:MAG: hypothetical protein ACI35S_06010 [Anaeroplasma sp.]